MSTCWQTVGFTDRTHSSWVSLTQSSSTSSEDYVGLSPHHSSDSWSGHQTQPFFSSSSHLMGCWFQTESQGIHLIPSPPPSLSICLPKALSMLIPTPERSHLYLPTLPNLRALANPAASWPFSQQLPSFLFSKTFSGQLAIQAWLLLEQQLWNRNATRNKTKVDVRV